MLVLPNFRPFLCKCLCVLWEDPSLWVWCFYFYTLNKPHTCFQTCRACIKHEPTLQTMLSCILIVLYMRTNTATHSYPVASREASHDCILKMFASTFLHVKAKVLIYLYIFHTAGKECPVSDVSPNPDILPQLTPGRSDLGRWQQQRSDMKYPRMGQPAAMSWGRERLRREGWCVGGLVKRNKKTEDKVTKLESISIKCMCPGSLWLV